MHAADDGDDVDNDAGDMKLMMMVEREMEDGATACLPTTWTTLPPSAYSCAAQSLVSRCQAGWAVLLTDTRSSD
jgi:hypothetical protein